MLGRSRSDWGSTEAIYTIATAAAAAADVLILHPVSEAKAKVPSSCNSSRDNRLALYPTSKAEAKVNGAGHGLTGSTQRQT